MKYRLFIVATVLLLATGSANAQTSKNGPMAKVTHSLAALYDQYTAHMAQGIRLPFRSGDPLVRLIDDRVVIDAVASGDVDSLKADLVFLGMDDAVAFGRIVSGHLPISTIPAMAGLASLQFAQPSVAIANTGRVTSQGDQAVRADAARMTFSVNGAGIRVGVLSDSFNCLGGAAGNVNSGDLSPVTVLQEISSCSDAADEGRAMLQIVHDVAPGAALFFASAFNGSAAFAANIQALAAAGAKVILDDTIYLDEPFFQDGIIAQAVDQAVASGVAYFSAAGNQGRQSYQSLFRPGNFFADGAIASVPGAPHFFGGTAHNFKTSGTRDHFQNITVPGNTTVTFLLQWDSPFFSVSGSPGTQNDVDIYVLDSSATRILAGGTFNNIGGDAVEQVGVTNTASIPLTVNLMIVKHSGLNPGFIKYVYFSSGRPPTINEYATNSSTVFGHANAAGAEAVGAAAYFDTPAFGVSPPVLESYSSAGGTPILFDVAGNRLATPDPRADKPGIVAPDGGDTTFLGSDTDGNGFPNFFGTSAATSHAAGVAALLLQSRPALTPAVIYASLENNAIDMGAPGFDNDRGFGLVQADAALAGNEVFVDQQYLDFLDRQPDPGGFSFWVAQLEGGFPRSSLIAVFMDSEEFHFEGKFIAQTYLGILARDADYGGFRAWLGALLAELPQEQIVKGFLDSGEFQANFGSNLTNGQFVETMYNNVLLRSSDPGGFSFWVGQLDSGQMTRAQVALIFLYSDEFQNLGASQNRVDISLLYFDMVRRGPDAGGFSAWLGALNAGVPLTAVIDGFLNSSEYQTRF